jgi:membrane protease YdiL (CAAX protease family)
MRVGLYLVVAFSFSWMFGAATLLFRGDDSVVAMISKTLLGVAFMFGPLVGAIVAQRVSGQKVLKPLGVVMSVNRWWFLAWFGPFLYAFLALVFALPLPGVEWSPDLSGFWARMASMVPPDQLEESRREMESVHPAVFWLLLIVQPLLAGPSVNAIAAFGEELGWRGFLFRAWAHLGFWKSSLLVGLVWGIWHAPLIAQGHNYAEHPFIGIGMMVVWCVLLSPPFTWLRHRTGSVVAVSVTHGTLNASAGIALMFISGGSDLMVGVTGLAGMLVLALVNLALVPLARNLSLEPSLT